jgi:bla regulator protein BlaR1
MIQALCWTLIHSLWQGLLFSIATGLVMLYTKRLAAVVRYNILCGLFFAFMAVCGCTLLWEWRAGDAGWREDGAARKGGMP